MILDPIALPGAWGPDASIAFDDLWEDGSHDRGYERNITVPTLTPVLPDGPAATGTGVVIAPGGALHFLSVDNEGLWVAQRLAGLGIAAFVLRYRLEPTPVDRRAFAPVRDRAMGDHAFMTGVGRARRAAAAEDGGGAIRLVRDRAGEFGVDPARVGLLGFSAGGFVAAVTATDAPAPARPSFVAPVYPAVWDEVVVPDPAPPMFLAWASDDGLGEAIVGSALRLYEAWWRAGVPVAAHAYASGGHGFGMSGQGTAAHRWFDEFVTWLGEAGF